MHQLNFYIYIDVKQFTESLFVSKNDDKDDKYCITSQQFLKPLLTHTHAHTHRAICISS